MVLKRNLENALTRERDGLTSHILLQQGDVPGDRLAITWVEVAAGATQRLHRHSPAQVYVILQGKGRMQVGDEAIDVVAGDMVYIQPQVIHGIQNVSDVALVYLSAATPAFDLTALYDRGDLSQAVDRS